MTYYAHSPKEGIPAQTYESHAQGVLYWARKFTAVASSFAVLDGELLLRIVEQASPFHDLGKLDKDNQTVLSGKKAARSLPKNHVDAGAAYFLDDKHPSVFAAAVIQAHHCGFPDFIAESNKPEAAFRDRKIMAEVDRELPNFEAIHNSLIKTDFLSGNDEIKGDGSVFLRLLLSCIVDADHTDTAIHYKKYPKTEKLVQLRPDGRLRKLNKHVADLEKDNSERTVLRGEMYSVCSNADTDADICSCDSPVGSGKTTAVMGHLLEQARKRGLRRIFVVLPFTNIISQSVETYRKALVLPGEKAEEVVAELHHRADFESEDARHLTALWRAPIIVTTAVAFFETLASNSTATLRRLHELPGSAIFVDESHAALPARLLPLAWNWISTYAKEWNCYWVLASGSLNRFWNIEEIAGNNPPVDVPEIVNDDLRKRLSKYEKRRIRYGCDLSPKSVDQLVQWVTSVKGPRLVIMNTVQNAAVLADCLSKHSGQEKVEHLSTALTAADREKTLNNIKKRLKDKNDTDWTLVATSCVEAGVDLSFRTGFREIASLVSLLQAAGRINREGRYDDAEIWSFCLAEGGMFNTNPGLKNSVAVLRGYFENDTEIRPELSTKSIDDEIKLYGLSSKCKKLTVHEGNRNFPAVEDEFKVISTDSKIAIVEEALVEKILHGSFNWHELQKNSVQIAEYKLNEVRAPEILPGIYHWNLLYDDFLGYMAGIIDSKNMVR